MDKPPTTTVTLKYPFEWEGKKITEVTLRRPKGSDLRAIEVIENTKGASRYDIAFGSYARLSDLPVEAFDEMDTADLAKVTALLKGFFPKEMLGKTGDPSSPT